VNGETYILWGAWEPWAEAVQQRAQLLRQHLPAVSLGAWGSSNTPPSPAFWVVVHRASNSDKVEFSFPKYSDKLKAGFVFLASLAGSVGL